MFTQQIEKFEKNIDHTINGYLLLLHQKELLKESIKSHKDFKIEYGVHAIQNALYECLLIHLHSWMFDSGKKSKGIGSIMDTFIGDDLNVKEFDCLIEDCKRQMRTLLESSERKRIKENRDKRIAHKDNSYVEMPLIGDVFFLFDQMAIILEYLNKLFFRRTILMDDYKNKAAHEAEVFWSAHK